MIMETIGELQLYINLLEQNNNRIYNSDFKEVIKDLKYEFGIDVTEDELFRLHDCTFEEDVIDKEILLKNIYSW